ncbi:MAG: SPOR domain-containing protein [Gammaproteobacteria bacterium]|nr:SPOR domain-containing protein [Gammaproteobacteria bacterium]
MHRSQLRLLARDHALGQIEGAEYRRRRADLIDAIVNGEITIRREPPPSSTGSGLAPVARSLRRSPVHVLVGVVVAIALIWALLYERDAGPPSNGAPAARDEPSGARLPAARALVEGFLRERDWSEENLAHFKSSWHALTPNEQAEARSAAWFRDLVGALRDEINAHKALAEFDGTGRASATGKRLAAFGEFLGIGAELPEAAPLPAPEPPPVVASAAPPPVAESPPAAAPRLTGSQWLAARADEDLTLQLFAANQLDRLEGLIAAHPRVDLHLLAFEGQAPRYRLVHGVFATREAADEAFRRLPPALVDGERPLIRRIADLRAGNAVGVALEAPEQRYTLQVFASASRANVDRLISRYPTLGMRVEPYAEAEASFRVVIGNYASMDAARAAASELPPALVEELGEPLIRSLGSE